VDSIEAFHKRAPGSAGAGRPPTLRLLIGMRKAVQQAPWCDAEPGSQPEDVVEPDAALSSFDLSEEGPVDAAARRQCLL
jgi:hypothetical protein